MANWTILFIALPVLVVVSHRFQYRGVSENLCEGLLDTIDTNQCNSSQFPQFCGEHDAGYIGTGVHHYCVFKGPQAWRMFFSSNLVSETSCKADLLGKVVKVPNSNCGWWSMCIAGAHVLRMGLVMIVFTAGSPMQKLCKEKLGGKTIHVAEAPSNRYGCFLERHPEVIGPSTSESAKTECEEALGGTSVELTEEVLGHAGANMGQYCIINGKHAAVGMHRSPIAQRVCKQALGGLAWPTPIPNDDTTVICVLKGERTVIGPYVHKLDSASHTTEECEEKLGGTEIAGIINSEFERSISSFEPGVPVSVHYCVLKTAPAVTPPYTSEVMKEQCLHQLGGIDVVLGDVSRPKPGEQHYCVLAQVEKRDFNVMNVVVIVLVCVGLLVSIGLVAVWIKRQRVWSLFGGSLLDSQQKISAEPADGVELSARSPSFVIG